MCRISKDTATRSHRAPVEPLPPPMVQYTFLMHEDGGYHGCLLPLLPLTELYRSRSPHRPDSHGTKISREGRRTFAGVGIDTASEQDALRRSHGGKCRHEAELEAPTCEERCSETRGSIKRQGRLMDMAHVQDVPVWVLPNWLEVSDGARVDATNTPAKMRSTYIISELQPMSKAELHASPSRAHGAFPF